MKSQFLRFVREEDGQDIIEYALLAGFISLAAITAITAIGDGLKTTYQRIADELPAGAEAPPAGGGAN